MNATVLGAGSFGTVLAKLLTENKNDVRIWGRDQELVRQINEKKENINYLPDFKLPSNLKATDNIKEAIKNTDLILSVLPTQATRNVVRTIKNDIPPNARIIVCSKGIEQTTHKLGCEIFIEVLGNDIKERLYSLSGPSFAREIASGMLTAVTLASYNKDNLKNIQAVLSSPYFRVYGVDDVIGIELGGALKNVIAIASGVSDGLGLGSNTRTAIITRGLAEISRLGMAMGAKLSTFMGLAGAGDLILTCTTDLSRNRRVGLQLGEGLKLEEILGNMKQVVEGITTTESVYEIAIKKKVSMPITSAVHSILHEQASPEEILNELMNGEIKLESE